MSTDVNEHLNDWLRDAHAMEKQAHTMLDSLASRLEHYPDLRSYLTQHREATHGQRDQLEACLKRRGSSVSALKDIGARLAAFGQELSGMLVSDEVVQGAMSCYVFKQMEIASYTVLVAAADAAGDQETKTVCAQILQQERQMAAWLLEHLPAITTAFLARAATPGAKAKV